VGPSGKTTAMAWLRKFPIKWGPQRVGPHLTTMFDPDNIPVSNQVGAPASGALISPALRLPLPRFPIKWGPQRVGPSSIPSSRRRSVHVSNQVGAPASGACGFFVAADLLHAQDVSNQVGAPASGAHLTLIPCQTDPIRFQSSGGPSEWGLDCRRGSRRNQEVSNQVGAPASGATC